MVTYVAYHGTTIDNAEDIRREGFTRQSLGPDEWLGDGYYFFEDSASWAWWWAKYWKDQGTVLKVTITVPRSAVLNLLDYHDWKRFHAYRNRILQRLHRTAHRVRVDRPFDGLIINALCEDDPGLRVIRAAFPEAEHHVDETVRRNKSRIRRIHVQLCCRDSEAITLVDNGENLIRRTDVS